MKRKKEEGGSITRRTKENVGTGAISSSYSTKLVLYRGYRGVVRRRYNRFLPSFLSSPPPFLISSILPRSFDPRSFPLPFPPRKDKLLR